MGFVVVLCRSGVGEGWELAWSGGGSLCVRENGRGRWVGVGNPEESVLGGVEQALGVRTDGQTGSSRLGGWTVAGFVGGWCSQGGRRRGEQ